MSCNLFKAVDHLRRLWASPVRFRELSLLACAAVVMNSSAAHAAIISSESFEDSGYPFASLLAGANPPVTGYTGAWTATDFGADHPFIFPNLSYAGAGYAAGTGNGLFIQADNSGIGPTNSGRVVRTLDTNLVATSATSGTRYLSWLFQSGQENLGANANTFGALALNNGDTADANRAFFAGAANGVSNTDFSFQLNGNSGPSAGLGLRNADVNLYVAKFEHSATDLSDTVTVWRNPTLGAGDPLGGVSFSGLNLVYDRLTFNNYDSNSLAWDEIRWGETFDDVTITAIPEPYSAAMLASVMGIVASRRQRFRRGRR